MSRSAGRDREEAAVARQETLERMHEQLAEQVGQLASAEGWQAWLSFARGFHQYSFNNCLLIMAQAPGASLVAGYRAWQARGRQVRRGEKAIRVFGPVTKREPRADLFGRPVLGPDGSPELVTWVVGVRPLSVFDVSQTDGPPLPEPPQARLLEGQAPPGLWEALASGVEAAGFTIVRGECGGANGLTDFTAREVRVRADVDDAQAVKTLAHEWAHVVLHSPQAREPFACRGVVEVEAESVAYMVTGAHGLDAGQYTFNYVAGWAHQAAGPDGPTVTEVLRHTGERVVRAAHAILDHTQPPVIEPTSAGVDATVGAAIGRAAPAAAGVEVVWEQVPSNPTMARALGPAHVARVQPAGRGVGGTRGDVPVSRGFA